MILIAFLQSIALTGGTVHTMAPGAKPGPATVLFEHDRIVAVGPDVEIPPNAQRVDVSGMHVIPGLIDGFVNHDPDHDRLYVGAGVTLVRDVGNDLAHVLAERDKDRQSGARDRGPGPAIWSSGAVIDGARPSTTAAIVVGSAEDAAQKLPRFLELEPDFVSIHSGLSQSAWRKVIELAHAGRLQVWGPLPAGSSLSEAVQAGQDGLYHLEAFLPAGRGWDQATSEDLEARVEKLAGSRVAVTPTLGVFAVRLLRPAERPVELDSLGPIYVTGWVTEAGIRQPLMTDDYLRTGLRVVDLQAKLVKKLHDRGVTIVPGSGSPNPWLFPGEALRNELSLLVRAGIPAGAVLEMATAGAARAIGADKDRGTIEPGKIADLVVVRGDPTADLASLHAPEKVVLRGRVLDRRMLDGLRADLVTTQKRLTAAALAPLAIAPPPDLPGSPGSAGSRGARLLEGTVETRAMGQRISGESFAVVRAEDGALVYCARIVVPGTASTAGSEVELTQTLRGGELVAFDARIKSGSRLIHVQGIRVGGSLNIERRVDGAFAGTFPVKDRIALVDVGSATAELILSRRAAGPLKAVIFEDFEPGVGNWDMRIGEDGTHLVKTHDGAMIARFAADGSIAEARREEGRSIATKTTLSVRSSGEGLPLPPGKTAFARPAPVPADAVAPPRKTGDEKDGR